MTLFCLGWNIYPNQTWNSPPGRPCAFPSSVGSPPHPEGCLPIRPVSLKVYVGGRHKEKGCPLQHWCLSISHPLLSGASLTPGQAHEPLGHPPWAPGQVGGHEDSPSNSPSGSARRAAGRLEGLHTSPAAPWRHCGSWQGSVSAVGEGRRQCEAPATRPAG